VTIYLNQLQPGQDKPHIRAGNWVLDATVTSINPNGGVVSPDPHGIFYRVVNVTESTGLVAGVVVPTVILELQSPIRKSNPFKGQGILVVMDGVAEVFEMGPQQP
jgi:hypothetical protein